MYQETSLIICDFSNDEVVKNWYVVDDGVMGGLSEGSFNSTSAGNALYSGTVRTENNGGFSSVRYGFKTKDVSNYKTVKLRLKGDGKSYQFRVKADRDTRYSYINSFETSGEWETISLSLASFYPSFRGNRLNKPNFGGDTMEEIAILIGNKTKESFSLEIEKVYLE
ncbi:CIA30 family protein [Aggregatimonas sangjinii]|uniref:CIA30 family protein n=2 Tax=Aggregatimonas sangjinii TaxID=2583587 RepID=A0A5B7SZE4_9FLAO|nr:CIA30 family protein [Aggregatimonas sangjinii]